MCPLSVPLFLPGSEDSPEKRKDSLAGAFRFARGVQGGGPLRFPCDGAFCINLYQFVLCFVRIAVGQDRFKAFAFGAVN